MPQLYINHINRRWSLLGCPGSSRGIGLGMSQQGFRSCCPGWPESATLKMPGEVREWLNRAVSKTVEPLRVPWVRIPPSPPRSLSCFQYGSHRAYLPVHDFVLEQGRCSPFIAGIGRIAHTPRAAPASVAGVVFWQPAPSTASPYRRSLKTRNFELAEQIRREIENGNRSAGEPKTITIKAAIDAFIRDCEARNLNPSTLRKSIELLPQVTAILTPTAGVGSEFTLFY
jgi:hypothetical protein